jgi:pimeloyl-[acyl-carrier protein] synthase
MASPATVAKTSRFFNRWYGRIFSRNPYPLYRFLRRRFPVLRTPVGFWIITRYADAYNILRDRRTSTFDLTALDTFPPDDGLRSMQVLLRPALQFRFPPDHTRLRRVMGKVFSPANLEAMRPRVQKIADRLLDAVRERGAMDAVADLAFPLPVAVLADLMGVPERDFPLLRDWVRSLGGSIDPAASANDPGVSVRDTIASAKRYFAGLAAERRKNPGEDLLSLLVSGEDRGEVASEDEVVSNAIFTLVAGHETTMNMLANGTLALLRNPDCADRLRRDPALIDSTVDEVLRYDSPAQVTFRTAMEPIEIGGRTVPPGEHLVVIMGAANRDPARFPDPDRFDVTRPDNNHLAFAGGIHRCIGEPLAKLEGRITFETLLRRMPKLRLAGQDYQWRRTMVLRGLERLPVAF